MGKRDFVSARLPEQRMWRTRGRDFETLHASFVYMLCVYAMLSPNSSCEKIIAQGSKWGGKSLFNTTFRAYTCFKGHI